MGQHAGTRCYPGLLIAIDACDNGIDDDGDGLADYRRFGIGDPDCNSPFDDSEQ